MKRRIAMDHACSLFISLLLSIQGGTADSDTSTINPIKVVVRTVFHEAVSSSESYYYAPRRWDLHLWKMLGVSSPQVNLTQRFGKSLCAHARRACRT